VKHKSKILIITLPFTLILLGLVIYEYGFSKVREERASIEEMKTFKTKSLAKHMAMVARKPQLEKKLALLKGIREADNRKIVDGQTIALAAASLQNIVKGIITARGGTIYSERVEKPGDYGNFKTISVTIDMSMPDTRALGDTLYDLESQTPFLIMKEFDSRVKNYREPKDLQVKLRLSAITAAK
jgi:hypothetical protein